MVPDGQAAEHLQVMRPHSIQVKINHIISSKLHPRMLLKIKVITATRVIKATSAEGSRMGSNSNIRKARISLKLAVTTSTPLQWDRLQGSKTMESSDDGNGIGGCGSITNFLVVNSGASRWSEQYPFA